jgi:hypothetical protein
MVSSSFFITVSLLCTFHTFHSALSWNSRNISTRRQLFSSAATATASTLLIVDSRKATAAAPQTLGEAVRESASNVPGYGQPDIYYPMAFQGSWRMHRQMIINNNNGATTLEFDFPVRFLQSLQDNAVVADRAFNQANLQNAMVKDSVQTCDWKLSNPNDLRLVLTDGSVTDMKVTKRSTERTESTVSSSEFIRFVTQEANKSVPEITAKRILTKWRVDDDGSVIQGLELVYDLSDGGDPMSMTSIRPTTPQSPVLVSKSRLTLTRE